MRIIMGLILILVSLQLSAETLMSTKSFLKSELSASNKMSREKFAIESGVLSSLKAVAKNADDQQAVFYYGKTAAGKLEKTCTVVQQRGKEAPMALGVCFNGQGLIGAIEILEFGEERGQKARKRSFLDQFKGKSAKDKLQVGRDIHAVSGASYTSEYVSEAIRKASFLYTKFVGGNK